MEQEEIFLLQTRSSHIKSSLILSNVNQVLWSESNLSFDYHFWDKISPWEKFSDSA